MTFHEKIAKRNQRRASFHHEVYTNQIQDFFFYWDKIARIVISDLKEKDRPPIFGRTCPFVAERTSSINARSCVCFVHETSELKVWTLLKTDTSHQQKSSSDTKKNIFRFRNYWQLFFQSQSERKYQAMKLTIMSKKKHTSPIQKISPWTRYLRNFIGMNSLWSRVGQRNPVTKRRKEYGHDSLHVVTILNRSDVMDWYCLAMNVLFTEDETISKIEPRDWRYNGDDRRSSTWFDYRESMIIPPKKFVS